MTPEQILAQLGLEDVTLVALDRLPRPAATASRGWAEAATADTPLPKLQFAAGSVVGGLEVYPYQVDPRCVAVVGVPIARAGRVTDIADGVVLDGRLGPAIATYRLDDVDVIVVNDAGAIETFRIDDPVALRLTRAKPLPDQLAAAPPSPSDLTGEDPLPAWLLARSTPTDGADPVDAIEALGLLARHAPGPVVARARAWAHTLTPDDVALIERWIDAEATLWLDGFELAVETAEPALVRGLVLGRDRLASLAAVRSLAGLGSPVHARLRRLDQRALDHRQHGPDPNAVGLSGDEALRAADQFDPDAWWAEYGR